MISENSAAPSGPLTISGFSGSRWYFAAGVVSAPVASPWPGSWDTVPSSLIFQVGWSAMFCSKIASWFASSW
jgi:hypothetical protein